MPEQVRDKFPECLVLSKEQLAVIHHKSRRIIIWGEVGCGKTLILLARLYKHTAKCLSQLPEPNYKKVLFVIPNEKSSFRAFVEKFIDDNCNRAYVSIENSVGNIAERVSSINDLHLILIDEVYFVQLNIVFRQSAKVPNVNICAAVLLLNNWLGSSVAKKEWTAFYLRKSYRCPVNIAIRCAKIRRKMFDETNSPIHVISRHGLGICLHYGVHVNNEQSVQMKSYKEDVMVECELPKKRFEEEDMLAVSFGSQISDWKALEGYTYHAFTHEDMEHSNVEKFQPFTGVQYHTVVCIFSPSKTWNRENKLLETFLYHSVSRTLRHILVICHEDDYDYFKGIKLLNPRS